MRLRIIPIFGWWRNTNRAGNFHNDVGGFFAWLVFATNQLVLLMVLLVSAFFCGWWHPTRRTPTERVWMRPRNFPTTFKKNLFQLFPSSFSCSSFFGWWQNTNRAGKFHSWLVFATNQLVFLSPPSTKIISTICLGKTKRIFDYDFLFPKHLFFYLNNK